MDNVKTQEMMDAITFIEEAFKRMPERSGRIVGSDNLCRIYSDAAAEPGKPVIIGWLIRVPGFPHRWGWKELPT